MVQSFLKIRWEDESSDRYLNSLMIPPARMARMDKPRSHQERGKEGDITTQSQSHDGGAQIPTLGGPRGQVHQLRRRRRRGAPATGLNHKGLRVKEIF